MGTMGYMSPEQVRGLPVDHRSDIFSFGTILYEMLSGKRAFKRDTASDTMAAILKEEPPELTQSGRNVSPALDHIVRHCLEKDRSNGGSSRRRTSRSRSRRRRLRRRRAACRLAAPATGKTKVLDRRRGGRRSRGAGLFLLRRPQRGGGRGRRRQARGGAAVREPGRSRGRLLRRRHRGCRSAASSLRCRASRSSPAAARRPTRRRPRRRRRSPASSTSTTC